MLLPSEDSCSLIKLLLIFVSTLQTHIHGTCLFLLPLSSNPLFNWNLVVVTIVSQRYCFLKHSKCLLISWFFCSLCDCFSHCILQFHRKNFDWWCNLWQTFCFYYATLLSLMCFVKMSFFQYCDETNVSSFELKRQKRKKIKKIK